MARYSRFIYEECIKVSQCSGMAGKQLNNILQWASLRKAFGKPLTEQPVIRAKLGAIYSKVEAGQSWLEREF